MCMWIMLDIPCTRGKTINHPRNHHNQMVLPQLPNGLFLTLFYILVLYMCIYIYICVYMYIYIVSWSASSPYPHDFASQRFASKNDLPPQQLWNSTYERTPLWSYWFLSWFTPWVNQDGYWKWPIYICLPIRVVIFRTSVGLPEGKREHITDITFCQCENADWYGFPASVPFIH